MIPESDDGAKLVSELDALLGPAPEAAAAPEPEPAAPPPAPPAPQGPRRILIADDNADYRALIVSVLKDRGFQTVEAKDGADGLRLALSQPFHAVVLDFDMPGLNGYEVIQELRGREETRKLPIIMLTGAEKRRQLRIMGLDVSAFLDKPVANAVLLEAVERAASSNASKFEPSQALVEPAPEPAPAPAPELEEETGEGDDLLIEDTKKEEEEAEEAAGLDVLAADSPIINRVNKLLVKSVEMGASDIHFEPQEKHMDVRVRLNGSLKRIAQFPAALSPQIAARIKILSSLIITERRRPQDGQVRAMIKGKKVEFRVSTIPALHGEKIVMRILGGAKLKENVAELGLRQRDLDVIGKALQNPHGLILVTGPTGSGKSTTLYTMIRQLNEPDVNIMTAEEPVEYELAGITQVPVKPHIGVTFESVLRSFLRQDPDIMLVGEIRDLETASIAVKAAITGHLVFSTLHTNSAPATVLRLSHMGVAPYLVADSVKLIVAQRLVKTLCPACAAKGPVPPAFAKMLEAEEAAYLKEVSEPKGCPACGQSGYKGRMPIFEVMEVRTPEIRQLILTSQSVDNLTRQAVAEGMMGLRRAALEALAAGKTSTSEALGIMLSE